MTRPLLPRLYVITLFQIDLDQVFFVHFIQFCNFKFFFSSYCYRIFFLFLSIYYY